MTSPAEAGRHTADGRSADVAHGHDRGSRSVRTLRRCGRRRHRRPVAAVDAGSPRDVRRAADQQHRRHHQLRDARDSASRCTRSISRRCASGKIIVRRAKAGETMTTLDGKKRTLTRRHAGDRRRGMRRRHRRRDGRRELGDHEQHDSGSCSKRRTSRRRRFASTSKKLGLKTEASIALRARRRSHRSAARDGARAASCSRQIGAGKPDGHDHRRLPVAVSAEDDAARSRAHRAACSAWTCRTMRSSES